MKNTAIILITSLFSAVIAVAIYKYFEASSEHAYLEGEMPARYTRLENNGLNDQTLRTFLSSSPTDFITAAVMVTPSVVNIRALENANTSWWGSGSFAASSGSGVILSADGYIVTNNHVIEDGSRFEVTLNDRREYDATLIASDPSTDLALLKIDEEGLPSLIFGNSDSVQVG